MPQSLPLITILGPTASGKTKLGVQLAKRFNGSIISADSRQVYRFMDIGTGKDLEEYEDIPYHLIDIKDPSYEYNLFEFVKDFSTSFKSIHSEGRQPFLVGGTGMYLDAILNRYELSPSDQTKESRSALECQSDDELRTLLTSLNDSNNTPLHNSTDLIDRERLIKAILISQNTHISNEVITPPSFEALTIGLQYPRTVTRKRITQRLKTRLKSGMIEEVESLIKKGISWDKLYFFGLEYRFIAQHLKGELSYNDMYQKLNSAIHQFAKQQEKWFRNIEKKQHTIHWLNTDEDLETQCSQLIEPYLTNRSSA